MAVVVGWSVLPSTAASEPGEDDSTPVAYAAMDRGTPYDLIGLSTTVLLIDDYEPSNTDRITLVDLGFQYYFARRRVAAYAHIPLMRRAAHFGHMTVLGNTEVGARHWIITGPRELSVGVAVVAPTGTGGLAEATYSRIADFPVLIEQSMTGRAHLTYVENWPSFQLRTDLGFDAMFDTGTNPKLDSSMMVLNHGWESEGRELYMRWNVGVANRRGDLRWSVELSNLAHLTRASGGELAHNATMSLSYAGADIRPTLAFSLPLDDNADLYAVSASVAVNLR